MNKEGEYVKWFSEINNKDVAIAGGKGASLGEMYNNKFPIPPGFVVTAQAYKHFIESTGLREKIKAVLDELNVDDTKSLELGATKIREMIESTKLSEDIAKPVIEAYDILDVNKEQLANAGEVALGILKKSKEPPFVAVRSSATTEDLATASFAGQQESFVNVKGHSELLEKIVECFASLFTARAVYYRVKKGFSHEESYIAVVVQKMVNSDKSGVIFSKNPVGEGNDIVIEAVWGLGEGIVSGRINPDHYVISPNLEKFTIKSLEIPKKDVAIVRDSSGKTITVKLTENKGKQQVLNNHELKILSEYALQLEEHYQKPQDIEFAISGRDIYIVQSRPITTKYKSEKKELSGEILLSGLGASPGIASGVVKIVHSLADLSKIKSGDVLVTEMTNPDMVVTMQKAAAIVTNEGGVTSHAAIVSREMGIPAVVGTVKATESLKEGMEITVDGGRGVVYAGKGETKLAEIKKVVPTKTKIKVIVDLPDFAARASSSGIKEVGLTRLEGIIAGSGKHPLYYVKNKDMESYIDVLVKGLKKLCAPFDEIWIRTSDIRTDEFRNLEGAPSEVENNPMLGDHGIRFSIKHKEVLDAEITAMKKIADMYPDKEIGIMMPQVISVEEVRAVKSAAERVGVPGNVKIGIMVETPAAVQIINQLCEEEIKFISFGTNDLTQYTLAIDRNNEAVQYLYDEMNPAVLSALSYVIRRCKKYGVKTSICGQAGSRPEMAKFLVGEGIDSISVNADAAYDVSLVVSEVEKSKGLKGVVEKVGKMIGIKEKTLGEEKNEERPVENKENISKQETSEKVNNIGGSQDIEEVILNELENEYNPSLNEGKKDIPALNDAIPVSSEDFEAEDKKEEEFDLNKELRES